MKSIDETEQPRQRVKATMPIRVRGMSTRQKFFDESTETSYVGRSSMITRIQSFVELETELHVINLTNNLGGTFRVIWTNIQGKDGWHDVGLELIEAEATLWGITFPLGEEADAPATHAWLQCQRCRQSNLTPVPEAEDEFIFDGFMISRPCDRCKATTSWGFTPFESEDTESAGETAVRPEQRKEMRSKMRPPLSMRIKVVREKHGTISEEICETVNSSRSGACFLSRKSYDVGEHVRVILPYKEGALLMPVPARVVRLEEAKGSPHHVIAIRLEEVRE